MKYLATNTTSIDYFDQLMEWKYSHLKTILNFFSSTLFTRTHDCKFKQSELGFSVYPNQTIAINSLDTNMALVVCRATENGEFNDFYAILTA